MSLIQKICIWRKAAGGVKLTIHVNLASKSRMSETISPRGRGQFTKVHGVTSQKMVLVFTAWRITGERARGRLKKNWMEGTRKAMNERNLNEGQWEDRKQWSLDVGQGTKTFWNRYKYIYIYIYIYKSQASVGVRAGLSRINWYQVRWNKPKLYKIAGHVYSKASSLHSQQCEQKRDYSVEYLVTRRRLDSNLVYGLNILKCSYRNWKFNSKYEIVLTHLLYLHINFQIIFYN